MDSTRTPGSAPDSQRECVGYMPWVWDVAGEGKAPFLFKGGVDPFSMQLLSTLIMRKSQCPQAGRLKDLMGLDDAASTIGAVLNSDRQGSGCCTRQQ